jgi:endonuclease/exonuclease/phosphatase family metal-dependent hydrolase
MTTTRPRTTVPGLVLRLLLVCACALVTAAVVPGSADAAYRFSAPRTLRATSATATTLGLRWAAPRGARTFQVQYAAASSMRGAKYLRTATPAATLRALRPATRYWFRVRVLKPGTSTALSAFTARTFPSARTAAAPAPVPPAPTGPVVWPSSTPVPGASTGPADVRVASFNLFGVNNDAGASGDQRTWRERRPTVVRQVLGEHPDVIGLQEANQSNTYAGHLDYGQTQYDDLVGALRAAGGHYAVTNESAYNCQKATSSTSCVPTYRGASNSTKILYDTDTLTLVDQGSMRYQAQAAGKIDRYLAWGVFRVKATGGELFFADTHLDSYDADVRVAQWGELIARVNLLRNGRPVVVVGDFNTTKFSSWAREMLPRMQAEGYGDVLDQQYQNPNAVSPRAQSLVDAWIGSSNRFARDVRDFAYEEARTTRIGNNIDWVFASNELRVKEWRTVVDYDPRTLQVSGVIPSDHCLVRATVVIP